MGISSIEATDDQFTGDCHGLRPRNDRLFGTASDMNVGAIHESPAPHQSVRQIGIGQSVSLQFFLIITFMTIQISNTASTHTPSVKILVYQGADCIAYSSGLVLNLQATQRLRPTNAPIRDPIIIFNQWFSFFIQSHSFVKLELVCQLFLRENWAYPFSYFT